MLSHRNHRVTPLFFPSCPNQPARRYGRGRVYLACGRMGMGCALVLQCCRGRRRGKGLEVQIGHGARIGVGREVSLAVESCKRGLRRLDHENEIGMNEEEYRDAHFKQIVRSICMIPSVRSSHSPPFPFTMPPIPDAPAPTRSVLSSIKSAFVHATIMGTPAVLCVNVPWPNGSIVPWRALDDARSGSADGSV